MKSMQNTKKQIYLNISIYCCVILIVFVSVGSIVYFSIMKKETKEFHLRNVESTLRLTKINTTPLIEYYGTKDVSVFSFDSTSVFDKIKPLDIIISNYNSKIIYSFDHSKVYTEYNSSDLEAKTVKGVVVRNDKANNIYVYDSKIVSSNKEIGGLHIIISNVYLNDRLDSMLKRIMYISVVLYLFVTALIVFVYTTRFSGIDLSDDTKLIGQYYIKKLINSGAMAELYLATSIDDLGKDYAVKKAKDDISPQALETFDYEAQLISKLKHSNVIEVYQYYRKKYAIVMEYIHGEDLGTIKKYHPNSLPVEMVVYVVLQIAKGLAYAHGVKNENNEPLIKAHRDIKPGNILISFKGDVKISDFGIAKANLIMQKKYMKDTQTGEIKGTLTYMSPEQALGEAPIDHRSDIFSLGIIFYELLSNQKFFIIRGQNDFELLNQIRLRFEESLSPLKEIAPDVPLELNRIVMKCLEYDVDKRYQNADLIKNELSEFIITNKIAYSKNDLAKFMIDNFKVEKTKIISNAKKSD